MRYMSKFGPNAMTGSAYPGISRKMLKKLRPPRYKPYFTMGYRGWAKSEMAPAQVPAPTIDQVRRKERKYGQKLHVNRGLLFFASDGIMFTNEEAKRRQGQCPKHT
jgi:hypothetical protein